MYIVNSFNIANTKSVLLEETKERRSVCDFVESGKELVSVGNTAQNSCLAGTMTTWRIYSDVLNTAFVLAIEM